MAALVNRVAVMAFALSALLGVQGGACTGGHSYQDGGSGGADGEVRGPAGATGRGGGTIGGSGGAVSSCLSRQEGEPCGGNVAHPCQCGSGLTCQPLDGGPPFGDVGGPCRKP